MSLAPEPLARTPLTDPRRPAAPGEQAPAKAQLSAAGRGAGDRRGADRAGPSDQPRLIAAGPGRADERDAADAGAAVYLPRQAYSFAAAMLTALVLAGFAAGVLPEPRFLIAALAALGLTTAVPLLARLEARMSGWALAAGPLLAGAGFVLPMAGIGFALAGWVAAGLPWQWAVATLVCLNTALATLVDLRTAPLFSAKIAAWAGFALLAPDPATLAAGIAAALGLTILALVHGRAERRRREAKEAAERVAARAADILKAFEDSGPGWFWESDRRGLISYISPKAAAVLGRTLDELRGRPLTELVAADPGSEAARALGFHLSARSPFKDLELRAATAAAAASERWWVLTGQPVHDAYGNFCGFRGHGTDLTEQLRSEQQVARLAHYDSLTGLANRAQMGRALAAILAAPSARERACALLMLDLDRFKQVNDTLGHPAGDELLRQVAQRLDRTVREGVGTGQCGRLGGDEFQVILPGALPQAELTALAQEIIAVLSQPYAIAGNNVVIGASVGIALAPDHGVTAPALTAHADLALYAAKSAGRGTFRLYTADLHAAAAERSALEQDLREAAARGQLALTYQAIVHIATEQIAGFEAALQWQHPERGLIAPETFLPIAEEAGLADALGQWMIAAACADMARWPERMTCLIRLSRAHLANPDFARTVAGALRQHGIAAHRLELKLSEEALVSDPAQTEQAVRALKRIGVRLALDDFGSGYAALRHLGKASFDSIKIDPAFVRGVTAPDSRSGVILASIANLAAQLGMDTTAQGVETLDELALVRLLGCSYVQGGVYGGAITAAAACQLAAAEPSAVASGPKSGRETRRALLRRVTVIESGERQRGLLRNISEGGAMIEGVTRVPPGTAVSVELRPGAVIGASVLWAEDQRIGIAFDQPLERASDGSFAVLRMPPDPADRAPLAAPGASLPGRRSLTAG